MPNTFFYSLRTQYSFFLKKETKTLCPRIQIAVLSGFYFTSWVGYSGAFWFGQSELEGREMRL